MIFSAALMGLATIGMCFLPSYAQIGLLATWGLLLLRMAQGLAIGGEVNTSAMFLVEHNPQRPLFTGSLVAVSCALGMFIGGACATVLSYFSYANAWRFVFAAVGLLSLWVCGLRKKLRESPEFIAKPLEHSVVRWRQHGRGLINVFVMGIYVSITVYICNIFWVSYAIDCQLWSRTSCVAVATVAQLLSALIAIPIGLLARSSQVYRLLHASMIVLCITAPLLFYSTTIQNTPAVFASLLGYAMGNGLLSSSLFYFLYLQLPVNLRCRGVSTFWAIAASFGASTLPLAQHLVSKGILWFPGVLVSIVAVGALLLCRRCEKHKQNRLCERRSDEAIVS